MFKNSFKILCEENGYFWSRMDYEALLKLAAHVAHYMPSGWLVDRRPVDTDRQHQGARIIGDHHKSIRLYQSYSTKGKIAVCGECPDFGLTWQERRQACLPSSSPTIKVSPTRKPQHIAADIERRLFPDYETMLKSAAETAERYKSRIEKIEQVEHALKCVMPELRNYQGNQNSNSRRYHLYKHQDNSSFRSGEIQASGYGGLSCDLTFYGVSVEKTIRILALLKED